MPSAVGNGRIDEGEAAACKDELPLLLARQAVQREILRAGVLQRVRAGKHAQLIVRQKRIRQGGAHILRKRRGVAAPVGGVAYEFLHAGAPGEDVFLRAGKRGLVIIHAALIAGKKVRHNVAHFLSSANSVGKRVERADGRAGYDAYLPAYAKLLQRAQHTYLIRALRAAAGEDEADIHFR